MKFRCQYCTLTNDVINMRTSTPVPGSSPRRVVSVEAALPLIAQEAEDFAASALDGSPPSVTEHDSLGNMAVLDEMRRIAGIDSTVE